MVRRVRDNLAPAKFRGVIIYPNQGYYPDNETLRQMYITRAERDAPVMAHCSAGGLWKFGLQPTQRAETSHTHKYREIFEEFPNLRMHLEPFRDASRR